VWSKFGVRVSGFDCSSHLLTSIPKSEKREGKEKCQELRYDSASVFLMEEKEKEKEKGEMFQTGSVLRFFLRGGTLSLILLEKKKKKERKREEREGRRRMRVRKH